MQNLQNINYLRVLEGSKKGLIQSLDANYPNIQLNNLVELSEIIEKEIEKNLNNSILKNFKFYFKLKLSKDGLHLTDNSNNLYQIVSSQILSERSTFLIRINHDSNRNLKYRSIEIPVVGYGKYNKIVFEFPLKLSSLIEQDNICNTIQEIYKTGYLWFYDIVSSVVNSDLKSLSAQLYSYIKKHLKDDELKKNFWFASITDGYGFRLVDEEVSKKSFDIIQSNTFAFDHSTNRYVAELLTTYLPEDILLMKKAIESEKCIDASLKQAQYKKDGSIYALTLASLYGCDSFTVYPIFKHEKVNVLALFDTKNKTNLSTFIEEHKIELIDICKIEASKIKNVLRVLKNKKVRSFWESLELKPGLFGISIDLKELYNRIIKKSR